MQCDASQMHPSSSKIQHFLKLSFQSQRNCENDLESDYTLTFVGATLINQQHIYFLL